MTAPEDGNPPDEHLDLSPQDNEAILEYTLGANVDEIKHGLLDVFQRNPERNAAQGLIIGTTFNMLTRIEAIGPEEAKTAIGIAEDISIRVGEDPAQITKPLEASFLERTIRIVAQAPLEERRLIAMARAVDRLSRLKVIIFVDGNRSVTTKRMAREAEVALNISEGIVTPKTHEKLTKMLDKSLEWPTLKD